MQRIAPFLQNKDNWISFHLNETGCFIVEQIKEGKSIGEIIKKISKQFDISLKKAEKDTFEFLSILKKVKIFEK